MAGIGFELEKLFEKDTYAADSTAYLTAGFVLAGPWIFGVLSVVLITTMTTTTLAQLDQTVFLIIATLAYAVAMFVTAPFYLPVTRYVADRLYSGQADSFGPSYAGYCLAHWIAAVLAGMLAFRGADLSGTVYLTGLVLVVACTQIWTSATFIGLLRSYVPVAVSFLAGYAVATVGAILGARHFGLEGALAGFTAGLCVLAAMLTATLLVQFAYPAHVNFGFLGTALRRPALIWIGVGLALGTWGDKLLFWFSPQHATIVARTLRFYPPYDISFFLGYITVIPAYAHFLLRIETSFARQVRHVYQTLVAREPYRQIRRGKAHMLEAMNRDYIGLIKLQAPLTLLAVYYAPAMLQQINLPLHQAHIVQFSALAACAIVVLQVQILYLLYFDLAEMAAIPAMIYGIGNLVFTRMTFSLGYWSYGLGHMAAAFLAATVGAIIVNRKAPQLEKLTLIHFAESTLGFRDGRARA